MAENGKTKVAGVPTAFRMRPKRRHQMELIQRELGHGHLSDTINLAIDRFVEQYMRGQVEEAA